MFFYLYITLAICWFGIGIKGNIDDVLRNLDPLQAHIIEDTINNTLTKECISQPADIVFLLDSSSSEGINHFGDQTKFVYAVTDSFEIGPDKVQISVVTFSEKPFNEFYLDQYHNKADLLNAINGIIYKPGNTQTDDGLDFVFHVSFLAEHGGRNNSEKIIIVLTDGESTDTRKTKAVADAIHSTNIRVISIGIGVDVAQEELLAIATDATNMYLVANFSLLSSFVLEVTKETCHTVGLTCRDTPADILFLLGTTSGMGPANFGIQLQFVQNFSREFDIGPDVVQFAVATYTNTTESSVWFDDFTDKTDVLAAIGKVPYNPGNTETQEALRFVREEAFTSMHGARNDSRHILILMTDGQSSEKGQTTLEAKAVHNSGIYVITIGIGANIDQDELKEISTGAQGQNVFAIANVDDLNLIELPIERQTCEFETVCSTRPADVVFLLDTSSSEGANHFYKELDFVSNFANRLIIGPDNVQISIVTFSSDAQVEFNLNQYRQKQPLLEAIQRVVYRPGDTQTDNGLNFISQNSFKPENGGRRNANQVVIVVTDGQSTQPQSTAAEAVVLHDRSVKVISVGIGVKIDNQELLDIASGKEFVFTVADFDALIQIELDIIETTCRANVTECSAEPREIIFLLDSSTSEGSANFKKQLKFVSSFVDGFDIGPNAVQVGIVTFSDGPVNRFYLNDYNSKAALKAAITGIPYSSGQTHTGSGLEFVRKFSLGPAHGARPDARKVVIVMTDGQSQQRLLTANQGILLRKEGVKVISVGIGQKINLGELAVIASDDKHILKVSSFDDLGSVESKLQDSVCSKLVCASTPADIMFILDTSSSIGPFNFHDMLKFINNFVYKFDVGTSAVQFGVVTFSNDVYPQFDFDQYPNKQRVIQAIKRIPYHFGSTYTEKVLDYVRKVSFTPQHGARSQSAHIAIILTDGQSHSIEKTKEAADALLAAGIEVISVGIGSAVNTEELSNIATNVSYVFSVATFDALDTIQTELLQATCSAQTSVASATVKPGPCGVGAMADVIFLLDSSNSEGPANFQEELRFVEQVVTDFNIGPDHFQFSIISFASNTHMWFGLNATSTESQLRFAILQVAYDGGLTYTNAALELARTEGFTEENGLRSGVKQFAIIVTDGQSTRRDLTLREAALLKARGIDIITVGVGNKVDPGELGTVATDSGSFILAKSFDDLSSHVKDIQQKLCSQTMTSSAVAQSASTMITQPSSTSDTQASTLPTTEETSQSLPARGTSPVTTETKSALPPFVPNPNPTTIK